MSASHFDSTATSLAPTPFSALIAGRTVSADGREVQFEVPPDWGQGRTTFGGAISAMAVQAMRDVAGAGWAPTVRLRALQTSFIGPVAAGPVTVRVHVLREGRNIRQVQALVMQAGETAAVLLGVYGSERETVVPVFAPARPDVTHPVETARQVPFTAGRAPNFTQHLDVRWGEGTMPYSGADSWTSRLHLRLKSEAVHPELLSVLLADAPPSPVISRFTQPTPASSVSWELELRPVEVPHDALAWWRIDTDVIAAAGGYVNQVSRLWTPAGELAAIGYQVVAVYG